MFNKNITIMAQIAQQDNLIIEDKEHGIAALGEPQKKKLKECVVAGTILDVVLVTTESAHKVNVTTILGYETDVTRPEAPTYKIYCLNSNTGAVATININ